VTETDVVELGHVISHAGLSRRTSPRWYSFPIWSAFCG
jgi:hypothetical protein